MDYNRIVGGEEVAETKAQTADVINDISYEHKRIRQSRERDELEQLFNSQSTHLHQ
jgi:hypothetical protein